MKTLTFKTTTRYAGGRSHHNITTIEHIDKDLFNAADYCGFYIYPAVGDDFAGGVEDSNQNLIMDVEEFSTYEKTGCGILDFGDSVFRTMQLIDVDEFEFAALPFDLRLEYISIWYNVTVEMLERAEEDCGSRAVFDFGSNDWYEYLK